MFGMLDYRAHKLYWLMMLPFRIISNIASFAIVFVSIAIAETFHYGILGKIIAALIIWQLLGAILLIALLLIDRGIKKIFFWLIDVVPAYGANEEEAETVVLTGGKVFLLNKKLLNEIEKWTDEDSKNYVSLICNWRVRIFFSEQERFSKVIERLKQLHNETGQEPRDLSHWGIKDVRISTVGHATWIEEAFVSPLFYLILFFLIVVVSVYYIG